MKKTLVLFDFDKTITTTDSFGHFVIKHFGYPKAASFVFLNTHKIMLHKIGLRNEKSIKESAISFFLKGFHRIELEHFFNLYAEKHLHEILNPRAINAIKKHQEKDHDIYIVTASFEEMVSVYADSIGVQCIGTKLHFDSGICSGKIFGENCKYDEKVNRVKQKLDLNNYDTIISYGDSKGDYAMFNISDICFYRSFK